MTVWLAMAGAVVVGAVLANAVTVHRYSPTHVAGEVAFGDRGLFFSRTPDGTWWRLRLRARRCTNGGSSGGWDDRPPDDGVREPRRPVGPGPLTSSVKLHGRDEGDA